jgi:sugar transferase (PEP-CTERM system associated)
MVRLFRIFIPASELTLFASEIVLILSAFTLAVYIDLPVDPSVFLLYDGGLTRIGLVAASVVLGLHFMDLYTNITVKQPILLLQQLCLVTGIAFLAQGLANYVNPNLTLPRRVMIWGSALMIALVFSWRVFYSSYVLRVMGRQRILFVGANPAILEIASHLENHPTVGFEVAGYLDDELPEGQELSSGKVIGPISTLRQVAEAVKPSRIVVGLSERRARMPVQDLLDLRFAGFMIEEAATTYEAVCRRVCTKELRPAQLIFSGEIGPNPRILGYHRLADLLAAAAAVIVLAPFLLLLALAVRLSSPGPALYRQRRVGLDGVPFLVYKFRSMYANAEEHTGAVWASKRDPRITPTGRFLRNYRLDELPQLLNVLRGEMSLVGPRPERPEFVKTLSEQIPFYRQRHCVRPGITGWAQINHKYGDSIEDTIRKLEYDLYYIKNMSFSLYTYIIFQTLKIILLSRGAQ